MNPKLRGLDEFAIEPVGDEVVVFDPVSMQYHTLNQSAFRVWRYSDGSRSLGEIAVDAFGEETPTTVHLVRYGLEELEHAGFMNSNAPISRRSALRMGISVVVGAGLLPTITSITAPDSASAASCIPGDPSKIDIYMNCTGIGSAGCKSCCCCADKITSNLAVCIPDASICVGDVRCV